MSSFDAASPSIESSPRLLLIQDDGGTRDDLRGSLASAGYDVTISSDSDSIVVVASEPPHLIVMEAGENVNAGDLARELKSLDGGRLIPIILVTPVADSNTRTQLYKSGVDDVFIAPVNLDELLARIQSLLNWRNVYRYLSDETHELQLAYETQRDSEALYHGLFTSLPVPCLVVNPKTNTISQANPAAADITGYHADQLNGLGLSVLCPGDSAETGSPGHDRDWISRLCSSAAVSTGEHGAVTREGTIVCADGSRVPVEAVVRQVEIHDRVVLVLILSDLRHRQESDRIRLDVERSSMLRQTAIAVNSKINDPLFVILNDLGSLQGVLGNADTAILSRLTRAMEAAQRIQRVTAQLSAISTVVTREYLPGVRMLDLDESVSASLDKIEEDDGGE